MAQRIDHRAGRAHDGCAGSLAQFLDHSGIAGRTAKETRGGASIDHEIEFFCRERLDGGERRIAIGG